MKRASAASVAPVPECTSDPPQDPSTPVRVYDVCVVGAGPHGLAVLSALHSTRTRMTDYQRERSFGSQVGGGKQEEGSGLSVCVVDESPWVAAWNERFKSLNIEWLRSPMMAHPSAFNEDALLTFARRTGREKEMKELNLWDSSGGGSSGGGSTNSTHMRGFMQAYTGMYALPSASLFRDFCAELAASLPHEFYAERAESVRLAIIYNLRPGVLERNDRDWGWVLTRTANATSGAEDHRVPGERDGQAAHSRARGGAHGGGALDHRA